MILLAVLLGCSGDGPDDTAAADPCEACSADEGCLMVDVFAPSDDRTMPWRLWDESDGVGVAYAAACDGTEELASGSASEDLVSGAVAHVFVGCLAGGAQADIVAFFDDDEDFSGEVCDDSSDFRDACDDEGTDPATITAGETTTVGVQLDAACG